MGGSVGEGVVGGDEGVGRGVGDVRTPLLFDEGDMDDMGGEEDKVMSGLEWHRNFGGGRPEWLTKEFSRDSVDIAEAFDWFDNLSDEEQYEVLDRVGYRAFEDRSVEGYEAAVRRAFEAFGVPSVMEGDVEGEFEVLSGIGGRAVWSGLLSDMLPDRGVNISRNLEEEDAADLYSDLLRYPFAEEDEPEATEMFLKHWGAIFPGVSFDPGRVSEYLDFLRDKYSFDWGREVLRSGVRCFTDCDGGMWLGSGLRTAIGQLGKGALGVAGYGLKRAGDLVVSPQRAINETASDVGKAAGAIAKAPFEGLEESGRRADAVREAKREARKYGIDLSDEDVRKANLRRSLGWGLREAHKRPGKSKGW